MMPTEAQKEWARQRTEARNRKQRFVRARRAEIDYNRKLQILARQIGDLAKGLAWTDTSAYEALEGLLRSYARVIAPWAHATATTMLADVFNRDKDAWRQLSHEIGENLRLEIEKTPTGDLFRRLREEQVALITSLPLEAAQRVHDLAIKGLSEGSRGDDIIQMILQTGEVTKSRAKLIARTETARAAANVNQARAEWIGSPGYIWRNVGDAEVRPALGSKHFAALNTLAKGSHRKLEGTTHRWDEPPIAGANGERAHPGCIYNCRCYAEVILPKT